jgi:hypothetical protein
MLVVKIILALLAYCPFVSLAVPHASLPDAINLAPLKNLTNELVPASKLYSGTWSSFPPMTQWASFDNMVSAPTQH